MKINILFPFPPKMPAGGTRVLYEYANRLNRLGNEVMIYYPLRCSFHVSKQPYLLRWLYFNLFTPPKWFRLDKGIQKTVIKKVSDKNVNDAEILLYTWWALSYDVQNLSKSKGRKFNLIQDIEFWTGNEDKVKASYFLADIQNIVISEHIRKFIYSLGSVVVAKVSFAIDHTKFYVATPIETRKRNSVCMMYSTEARKGSKLGLEALSALKKKYPSLNITIFSVFDIDEKVDFDFDFYKEPSNLPQIMNESAIFLSPSVQEGCALPPMEAMHCGCALICSNIEGHSEYAIDNETAILFESENKEDLMNKVIYLLEHDEIRKKIAAKGNNYIRMNTWESSTNELAEIFNQIN